MRLKMLMHCVISALALHSMAAPGVCREIKKCSIEQFIETVSVGGSSFSFDEKAVLFSGNQNGVFSAFVIPVQGGEPSQVTSSKGDSVFALPASIKHTCFADASLPTPGFLAST